MAVSPLLREIRMRAICGHLLLLNQNAKDFDGIVEGF
jgi:hypothetical protein